MLPKANRLKQKSEISKVFNKGDSIKESSLICKYLKNNKANHRTCFTISKKLKTKAVTRNRYRRQMAYAFKNATSNKKQKVYYDFVFILYKIPSKSTSRFKAFESDFTQIINKLTDSNV